MSQTKANLQPLKQPVYDMRKVYKFDHDLGDPVRMVGAPDIEAVVTAILVRKTGVTYELTWIYNGEIKTGWLNDDLLEKRKKKDRIGFHKKA